MRVHRAILWLALSASPVCGPGVTLPNGSPDPSYASLWTWLDTSSGVNGATGTPADGTAVTRWDDLGYRGNDLTRTGSASELPTYRDDGSSCGPAIVFDGTDYLWAATSDIGRASGARTIFVAARIDSADGGYVFDGSTSSGRSTLHTGQSSTPGAWNIYFGDTTGGGLMPPGPSVRTGGFQVHTLILDAGRQEHRIDGQLVTQDTQAQVYNLGGIVLGARFNLANRLRGALREVLIYDAALGTADIAAMEAYLLARHAETPPPPPPVVDVFAGGDGIYPNYRIPAITRTVNGTLLAFAEGRQSGNDQSQNDIVLRRSFDGGMTWAPHQILHDDGVNALNNPMVVQATTGPNAGRIFLCYQRYPRGTTIWNAATGYTASNIVSCFLMHSDDDGATWAGPFDVTRDMKPPSFARSVNGGPGIGIQLRHGPYAGRIVLPFNRYDLDGTWGNYAVYSDDGGATWLRGNDVPRNPSIIEGNECQMVERADGSVMLDSRRSTGAANRKTALSTDGGVTWSPLAEQPGLPSPACMAGMLRFTDAADGYRNRILYAGPNSTGSRVNGAVKISYDEGATWTSGKVFAPGSYAYSCLTQVDARRFGVLYERDNYQRVSFVAMTLEWATDRADCLGNGAHGGPFGAGCADGAGLLPDLGVDGCPSPGGCFDWTLAQAGPSRATSLIVGLGRGALPIGTCSILVAQPLAAIPLAVDPNGAASLRWRIPGTVSAFGLTAQTVGLDPTAPAGLVASPGYELIVF
ncbi:MAG: exo-alpha-sialidase [Planctomycetota bacterium]